MTQGVTRPRAQGFGCLLAEDWYRVAPSREQPIRVYTRDSLAERADDRGSPEENVLDIGYAFSRSNLTGGEGLDFFPRQGGVGGSDRDKIRFWDSADLIIERPDSGEPFALRLAPDSQTWWTPGATPVDIGESADRLYIIQGTNVSRFNDLADTTADDTDNIGVTLVQIAVATDNAVAVLDANGDIWYKAPFTETYLRVYDSTVSGPQPTDAKAIWLVKGRILAYCRNLANADDGFLLEISPVITGTVGSPTAGAHTFTIVDRFGAAMLDCVDAGHAIVACFSDGSLRSYVPQTDGAGGVPLLTIRGRSPVPIGETPYTLCWNLGVLLIFTIDVDQDHARLYVGSVLDDRFDFAVGPLQLVRTWKNSVESSPAYTNQPLATRDAVYFFMGESTANWNLWRYDLVSGGLFRETAVSADTRPFGLSDFEDHKVYGVGSTIIRQNDNYRASGYLITPNITFGLNTPINWTAFVIEALNVDVGGAKVELYYSTDPAAIRDPNDAGWLLVTTVANAAQSGVEQTRVNVTSNQLALQIKIYASTDQTETPEVPKVGLRGIPKHRDWIAEVPIDISDWIEAPFRKPLRIPEWGDTIYDTLSAQQGASTVLQLLDPPTVLRGVVDNLGTPVDYVTERGSQGRYTVLMFRGSKLASEEEAASGNAGLGIATLGISGLGIGDV